MVQLLKVRMQASCLAGTDKDTQRAGVVVLKEVQRKAVDRGNVKGDLGTGRARVGADDIAVAGSDGADHAVLELGGRHVGVRGAGVGVAVQEVRVNATLSVESVAARLELAKLGEEEDQRALLASV